QIRPRWSESRLLASIQSTSILVPPIQFAPIRFAPRQLAPIQPAPREVAPREVAPREVAPREFGSKLIGVLICFESSFGYLARRLARGGADVIVVLTQDGWWGKSAGYQQHLAFNRLRAIETRLPLAQVSATGITALISPSGRVVSSMGWMERGSLSWSMATRRFGSTDTLYTRFGDWPGPLSAIFIAFLILTGVHRRSRTRNRNQH
ncbi:MAG: nitrilase-related carbon-nitrogen hydrolase, partial [Rhodothermia bacterium]